MKKLSCKKLTYHFFKGHINLKNIMHTSNVANFNKVFEKTPTDTGCFKKFVNFNTM